VPGGPTNPDVTPELSVVGLKGSFPGDLGIELVEIDDDSVTGRLLVGTSTAASGSRSPIRWRPGERCAT
jgi:hypothetical protein